MDVCEVLCDHLMDLMKLLCDNSFSLSCVTMMKKRLNKISRHKRLLRSFAADTVCQVCFYILLIGTLPINLFWSEKTFKAR